MVVEKNSRIVTESLNQNKQRRERVDALSAIEWIRGVIRLSIRYRLNSGFRRELMNLPQLKQVFKDEGMEKEAFQVELIENYLLLEEKITLRKNELLVAKVMDLKNSIPVNTKVIFKYQNEIHYGEVLGFLADRVLVVKEDETHRYIYEVFPNDIEIMAE